MMSLLLLALFVTLNCTPKSRVADETVVSFLDANIPHLDPIHSTNKYSSTINGSIFEGLYHYHYFKRPYSLEPQLAEGMPEISPDGLTYKILIKKGVYFQDDDAFPNGKGRELVAQDFIDSWKRLADSKNKALGWWVFDGLIDGLNPWRDELRKGNVSYDSPISGLSAPDSHTLLIKLTRPSFQFMHYLAMPVTMVTAKEVVNKYGPEIINHPVGTGPYILKLWNRNSEVILEVNKSYRKTFFPSDLAITAEFKEAVKFSGKSLPLAKKIVVKILRERQPEWLSFLKGQIDHGIIPIENNDQVFPDGKLNIELANKQIKIFEYQKSDIIFMSFNLEHPIVGKNKHLRKAFAHAINKSLIREKFYSNRGVIAQSPIPPEFEAYDENYKNPYDYDVEKAKAELILAGYPNGQGLPVFDYDLANVDPWSRQFGEFVKDQLGLVGIKIKLIPNTWPQFDKKLKTKKVTIFNMAWTPDYPDSENFLQLYYSKNISPGPNNANFINREYDTLFEKALRLNVSEERNQLYKQMVQIINEEVPSLFIIHRTFRMPYHSWLKNFTESPLIYDHLQYYSVDNKIKDKTIKKL